MKYKKILLSFLLIIIVAGVGYFTYKKFVPKKYEVTSSFTSETFGKYLTDKDGMTLYINSEYPNSLPVCNYDCLNLWRPFVASVAYEKDFKENSKFDDHITIVKRVDGLLQYAYDGNLLYKFVGDGRPGHTSGLNVSGKKWRLIILDK